MPAAATDASRSGRRYRLSCRSCRRYVPKSPTAAPSATAVAAVRMRLYAGSVTMPRLPDEVCSADCAELVLVRPARSGGSGSELATGQQLNYGGRGRLLTACGSQVYSRRTPGAAPIPGGEGPGRGRRQGG